MKLRNLSAKRSVATLALLALSPLGSLSASALAAHNVSQGVQLANDQGPVDKNKEQKLTIVLKLPDQAAYDKAVEALYDPSSPTFHKWFTDADFKKFAPTDADLKTVKTELEKQGLEVLSVDPLNFSIRVHGTTGAVETAFQTQLRNFSYKKTTFQAHVTDAQLTGEAGQLVDSVVGLDRHQAKPMVTYAINPATGKALYQKPVANATVGSTLLGEITGTALTAPSVSVFQTPNASVPVGVYYGTNYDADFAANLSSPVYVSYTPKQLQTHYGLAPLYKAGYDGTGQTIALVEAFGYSNALQDANTAFATFGVTPLTSSTFSVIYPDGQPGLPNAGYELGWSGEIALDIQAAHAIAPGAKITEVVSRGQDDEDFISALNYIITNKVANTVSSSWELDIEVLAGPAEADAFNSVLEHGAAAGISFQFSSGDYGDNYLASPVGDVTIPADAPYATAVGGTSVLNNPSGGADIVAGWGTSFSYLYVGQPVDPPGTSDYSYFYAGSGGGESILLPKPSWQEALPGSGRQVPDVSAIADPYTGFSIIGSQLNGAGVPVQVAIPGVGGTSLASPVFTAMWAIADQYNGAPLGHAGHAVPKLKTGEITDVLGTSSLNISDVTGTVYDANGATYYSADALFENAYPNQTQTEFPSAQLNYGTGFETIAIAFGLDSTLTVTPGWDNVTGYGEPNGLPFIQGVTGKTTGAAVAKK